MPRTSPPGSDPIPFLDEVLAFGDGAPNIERRLELAHAIRALSRDVSRRLDRELFERLAGLYQGLTTAQAAQAELRAMLDQLDSPPWHPALFLRPVET